MTDVIHAPAPAADGGFTLDALLAPLTADAFSQEYQGRREWIHSGPQDRFEGLLSWRTLNALIRDQRPAGPRFRLIKGGRRIPEEAYHRTAHTLRGPLRLLDPARFLAELRGGATLVWDAIDQGHPPIRAMKNELERALRAFVFVNMYASWGTLSGTDDHWDDHDVFVLQLTGRKHWRVHPATRSWPMPGDEVTDPPAAYAHEWTLTPGTVLYLPRGWWHRATPVGEPSLHLTIGVLRPTNADLLEWLLARAQASELVRQDVPWPMDDDERVAHAAALRSVLDKWVHAGNIELFERAQDAAHYVDPRPTLQAVGDARPEAWDPDASALFLSTRARVETHGADVVLIVGGAEWWAPKAAGPLLADLVAGHPVRLGTLLAQVPDALVAELVTAGILAVD
jgi:ribosomal protein L16 Arg81 hydroxylase